MIKLLSRQTTALRFVNPSPAKITIFFPYTSLFRSLTHDEGWQFIQLGKLLERADKTLRLLDNQYHLLRELANPARSSRSVLSARDRKSTRLNSSHVAISYAVFCLKKKVITSHSIFS